MSAQKRMPAKTVRVFPLVTAPLPGESLDSWLEAIAVRMDVTVAELYEHMGFRPPYGALSSHLNRKPTPSEANAIATATGCRVEDITAMTLSRYPADVLGIDQDTGEFIRRVPWGRVHGSRFCPHCLGGAGGAWQLNWRLIWTFACLQHHCLLADRCPRCDAAQRYWYQTGNEHPRPGQCVGSTGGRPVGRAPRCDADLAQAHVLDLPAHHPALMAQSAINDLLDRDTATFGIYAEHPQPVPAVLADLRLLGRGIVWATPIHHIDRIVAQDLAEHYRKTLAKHDIRRTDRVQYGRRMKEKPPSAVSTAIAVTAALPILNHRTLQEAADAVTALYDHLDRRIFDIAVAAHGGSNRGASPVLDAVHTMARGARLTSVEQLRRRLGTSLPGRPFDDTARRNRLIHSTPTMLWPAWSLRLCPPASFQRIVRAALAPTILLVNTRMGVKDATVALGGHVTYHSVIQLLAHLAESGHWDAIRAALIRLADYLDSDGSPIDYQRRRRLDYTSLLPDNRWRTIARTNTTRPEGASTARNYLRQRLSGVPTIATPVPSWEYDAYAALLRFPARLNPELLTALDDYAVEYLATQGITDEPAHWEPSITLINELRLPGLDVDTIDTTELHYLLRNEQLDIAAAATRIGSSTDAVRIALERRPAHRDPKPASTPRIGPRRASRPYLTAMSAFPKDKFVEQYLQQHRSLGELAAMAGVSRATIVELRRDYAIPLRATWAKHEIDRDWLVTEYITNHRTFSDLAHELGVSRSVIAYRAKIYGLVARGMRRRHVDDVQVNGAIPEFLIPALVGQGGWERLQHFVAAVEHPNYTVAAQHLGVHVTTLSHQIRRIERELGHRLVTPGTNLEPLKLTRFGRVVRAAVEDVAAAGGP